MICGVGVPYASHGNVTDSPTLTYITSGGFTRNCGGAIINELDKNNEKKNVKNSMNFKELLNV